MNKYLHTLEAKSMKFKTDALARILALQPYLYRPVEEPGLTPEQIESETARLNALSKDRQVQVFCDAMGFGVLDFLSDRAEANGEAMNCIEWMDL
jgi:hypothetical protein